MMLLLYALGIVSSTFLLLIESFYLAMGKYSTARKVLSAIILIILATLLLTCIKGITEQMLITALANPNSAF